MAFVEDELIAGVETFIRDADRYTGDLQLRAQGLAAAQAVKEEAVKRGTAGLGAAQTAALTVPSSPKITRPRPPKFQEPMVIEQVVRC